MVYDNKASNNNQKTNSIALSHFVVDCIHNDGYQKKKSIPIDSTELPAK